MSNTKLKFPSETIDLPSKGLVYNQDNPLSSGQIEMKYMTAYHEDILTNQNFIEKGVVLDKLLRSLISSPDVKYEDLIVQDKDALLIAARILGYGKDYEFEYKDQKITIDLSTLKNKELDDELFKPGINEFEFKLPHSGTNITFKFLNGHDEENISKEIKGLKKIYKENTPDGVVRLKYIITSIEGQRDKKDIYNFVDNDLLAMDARELRKYIRKIQPEVITKVDIEDLEEEINIPIGINFFWPDIEL